MNRVDSYLIEVKLKGKTHPFIVVKKTINGVLHYDVAEHGELHFTLICCTDEVQDTLKLTADFQNSNIDPAIVLAVADVIMSEEE